MSHYLCRFLDEAGASQGEVPIIASSESDAVERARSLYHHRAEHYGFELWYEARRIVRELRGESDKASDARPG